MAAAERASEGEHAGSHFDMHIREGLIEPHHVASMGPALWLYLYLHKRAAWKTGRVTHYTHAAAAAALGKSERTVGRYMERLRRGGYVIVAQGRYDLTVGITRFRLPGKPPGEPPPGPSIVSTLRPQEEPSREVQGRQSCPSGWTDVATDSYSQDSTHEDDTAAAQQATAAAPQAPDKDAPVPAAGAAPAGVLPASVAAAVLRAQGRPASGPGVRRLVRASKEEVSDPYQGRVSDAQIAACLAYMRTKPYFVGSPHLLTPRSLAEELGPWLAAGQPARYAPPAAPTRRERGAWRRQPDDAFTTTMPDGPSASCFCLATLNMGQQHRRGCGCTGIATTENSYLPYRDGPRAGIYER